MTAKRKDRPGTGPPWWLDGNEGCLFCFQFYVVEMEVRCPFCDRPLCPACGDSAREDGGETCADCRREQADENPAQVAPEGVT